MRGLVWTVTCGVIALWTLLAWAAHGLVGAAGGIVAGHADLMPLDPLLVEWGWWLASAGAGLGQWLVILLWAIVSVVLLAVGFIASRLMQRVLPARR